VGTASEGLRWSVEGLAMAPDGRVGTSNQTTGGRVRIGFAPARMLVLLPVGCLPAAVAALGVRPPAGGW
jgi:thiamine pyrophosphokinase